MTDEQHATLLTAVEQGDCDALQALIVHHHATLRARVSAAVRPEISRRLDADDVLQQAYVAAFRALNGAAASQRSDSERDPHRDHDQNRDREGAAEPSPLPGGTTGGADSDGDHPARETAPPRFDGPGHFYKWLERIALNQLSNMVRDLKRQKRDYRREAAPPADARTSYPRLAEHLAATESTPSKHVAREEAVAAVMSSLARLSEDQREVVRLRFIEARPVPEVAAALGKTDAAVHALCYRGLKELRRSLTSITHFLSSL